MGERADGADLTRVNSYQWPSGHVAHLTEGQLGALARFKKICQEKGYYNPGDNEIPPTHDDETLLRYLRARKFIPSEAFTQFKDTEDWRKEHQLDKLYDTIDIHEYDQTRRLYPQWTGRRDKRGIPFYVYEIGDLDPKEVSVYSNSKDSKKQSTNTKTPWRMLKLFALYENLCRFILPMCSAIPDRPHGETPISQSNNIVDLSGVGFQKLWNLRSHMSDASKLATAHYPETLDRIFVVGAPSYFPTVWGWVQKWFDPITVSKIFILSPKDMASTLSKYVDRDNFPKKYGGNLDWKFGDMPNLEPAIVNSMRWKEDIQLNGHRTLPIGPIRWEYDENGDLMAMAVGTENGKPRRRVIAGLHPEPTVAPLALSPGRVDAPLSPTASRTTAHASEAAAPIQSTSNMASSDLSANGVQATSTTGTYIMPFKDNSANGVSSPAADSRAGTSSTKFAQQDGTHAHGQLADGTPQQHRDARGERQAVVEPNTVGQAPKEHPMKEPDFEEPQPSMMEQAKDTAGQAVEQAKVLPTTVMSAVGLGGQTTETKEQEVRKEDPAIDRMDGKNVEEFLRSQTKSKREQT
ncbi:hypothetical protein LTR37_007022 [Vermiconidia calcicola]|uniref:Uncharacterized protein n=1 Tax=Vermiconidia calcicola TaxID=1690605 RepID=A0ACC3NEI0_9PEZI|nr:hypothetical protein LTR37_007022 [Vermiconidia calcicola]